MKNVIRVAVAVIIVAGLWLALKHSTQENQAPEPELAYQGVAVQTLPDSFVLAIGVRTMEAARDAEKKTIKFDANTQFEILALEDFQDPDILPGNISYLEPGAQLEVTLVKGSDDLAAKIGVKQYLEPVIVPDAL